MLPKGQWANVTVTLRDGLCLSSLTKQQQEPTWINLCHSIQLHISRVPRRAFHMGCGSPRAVLPHRDTQLGWSHINLCLQFIQSSKHFCRATHMASFTVLTLVCSIPVPMVAGFITDFTKSLDKDKNGCHCFYLRFTLAISSLYSPYKQAKVEMLMQDAQFFFQISTVWTIYGCGATNLLLFHNSSVCCDA